MKITAIIQARMTSKRFPGKMLAPFLNKPILFHVINQIKSSNLKPNIIIATSKDVSDDPLAAYANSLGVKVVRGPLEDVLGRFRVTLLKNKCDAFFRVCGDSPLLSPQLIDTAFLIYKNNKYDLVTNIFPKTFAPGLSIELINTKTFLKTEQIIVDESEREHMTKYFYLYSKNFRIYNFKCMLSKIPDLKLAIDKLNDIKRIEKWYLDQGKAYLDLLAFELNKLHR